MPQQDGYRFVYVLPFTRRQVLVEDTLYADGPELDPTTMEQGVLDYATRQGARVTHVRRRESGVLPLPFVEPTGRRRTAALCASAIGAVSFIR